MPKSVSVCETKGKDETSGGCSNCNRSNPSKRCSKRHAKCLKKLFCDSICEQAAHKKKTVVVSSEGQENLQEAITTVSDDTKAKAEIAAAKKKKDKKAKKKPNAGTTPRRLPGLKRIFSKSDYE